MASYDKPILTTQGISALNQVNAGKSKITYTKVVFSSDDYNNLTDDDVSKLTSITNQEIIVQNPNSYALNNGMKVRAIGENSQLDNAYYIKCYATFAKLDNGQEFLFCISLSQTADYMPAFDKINANYVLYSFQYAISSTDNITMTDSSEVYLTLADLNQALLNYVTKGFYFSNMPKLPNNIVTGMPSNPPFLECHMDSGKIAYTIKPPFFYGRAEIEKYTLYYKADSDSDFNQITVPLDNLTGTISNIDLGQKYTLQATATNQMGESEPSTATSLVTGNVPTNVKLAVNIDSANATINWSATADADSRTPVTSYTLYFRDVNSSWWKTTNDSSVTGFTYGHSYELKAVATNVVGDSDYSDSQTVIMATRPYNCQLTVTPDYTNQSVSWSATANSDYGLPILSYTLYYRDVTANSDWITTTNSMVTSLSMHHTYNFKAVATNTVGDSDYSTQQQFTMLDGKVYGVSYDGNSQGTLVRTDDSVGLSDFSTVGPWSNFETVSNNFGKFLRVKKIYISKSPSFWKVSEVSHGDNWYLPKCFWDFNQNCELPYVDICIDHFQAGGNPYLDSDRNYARSLGSGFQILDIHIYDMLVALFLVDKATLNTGLILEQLSYKYYGINNFLTGIHVDGVTSHYEDIYVCDDADRYSTGVLAYPYKKIGYQIPKYGGTVKTLGYDSNFPNVSLPSSIYRYSGYYYSKYDNNDTTGQMLINNGIFAIGFWMPTMCASDSVLCRKAVN